MFTIGIRFERKNIIIREFDRYFTLISHVKKKKKNCMIQTFVVKAEKTKAMLQLR